MFWLTDTVSPLRDVDYEYCHVRPGNLDECLRMSKKCIRNVHELLVAKALEKRTQLAHVRNFTWEFEPTSPSSPAGGISKIIHTLWIGSARMPASYVGYITSWATHHPGWATRHWTEKDVAGVLSHGITSDLYHRLFDARARADVLRYEILHQFGGVYVDADLQAIQNIEALLGSATLFFGREDGHQVNNAVIGATERHPFIRFILLNMRSWSDFSTSRGYRHVWDVTGPNYLRAALDAFRPDARLVEPIHFYPVHFSITHYPASRSVLAAAVTREVGHSGWAAWTSCSDRLR